MKPVRTLLAVALTLAAAPALAQTYSQTIFFGDSLTDAGYFRPLLPSAVMGQFTTNPDFVWAQHVAEYFGTSATANGNGQTGTDYAVGGARVGTNVTGALGPIPALTTQLGNYLASTGGQADPNALYTVWGGANDLFAIAAAPSQAQAIITSAVTAQVGIIGTLKAAGAQYILVPSIPDMGQTPAARAQGPAAQAQFSTLAATYNQFLFDGLAANGLRVIPLDTYHLIGEIVGSPATYGFGNVTGTACQPQITANSLTCTPASYITPDANQTYAFADGVHPSGGAHRILADYALSVLEAPRQMAVLPHSAAVAGRARAERIANRLSKPEADGKRWWVDLRGDFQRYDHGNNYDGAGPALTGGIEWANGQQVSGFYLGYGRMAQDWGHRGGQFDQGEFSLGGYTGWFGEHAWWNGQISYGRLDYDIDRNVRLGPAMRVHHGSAGGDNLSAGMSTGWNFGNGDSCRHGPVLSVLVQSLEVDDFAESEPTLSTSLAYPTQNGDSLLGSIGWQANFTINDSLKPYARLTYDHEFKDDPEQVSARLQTLPDNPYSVPGVAFDKSYGSVLLGAQTKLFGLEANLGAHLTVGQDGGDNTTVFATVGGSF